MKRILSLGAAVMFSAFSMAIAEPLLRQIPVHDGFTRNKLRWQQEGIGYDYLWTVQKRNGMFEVCGLGKFPNLSTRRPSVKVMRRAYVEFEGKVILKDLSFFTEVKRSQQLIHAAATCRQTRTRAPRGHFSVQLITPWGYARL